MSRVSAVGVAAAAGILAACSATLPQRAEAPGASSPVMSFEHHNFNYALTDRERVQLIQAFDDGQKTYLQFTRAPSQPIIVENSADKSVLGYLPNGAYLVIPGVYDHLTVKIGQQSASITNYAAVARANTPTAVPGSRPEAQSPVELARAQVLQTQIDALQARVRDLESQLVTAHAAGRAAGVYVNADGVSPRVVIRFGNNSHVVEIDEGLLQALTRTAQAARRVYLHGRTDAFTLTPGAAELAVERATAVKQLLVAQGMSPNRIRIFYRGAGGFAADNHTVEGKAANRRVEIQMIKG